MKKLRLLLPATILTLLLGFSTPVISQDANQPNAAYDEDDEDDNDNYGLVGLLGLIGLAGLIKRDKGVVVKDRDRPNINR